MVGQADVVDDEAAVLVLGHPVHPGDGLQQVVLPQLLVDVHHLLDRRVEAGQQHVADDQEGDAGQRLVRVVEVEGLAEVLDRIPALRFLARLGDDRELVRGVGRNTTTAAFRNSMRRIKLVVGLRL